MPGGVDIQRRSEFSLVQVRLGLFYLVLPPGSPAQHTQPALPTPELLALLLGLAQVSSVPLCGLG